MDEELNKILAAHRADVLRPPSHVVQQWHDAIGRAADLDRGRERDRERRWHPGLFLPGIAAALAIGIAIGLLLSTNDDGAEPAVADRPAVASTRETVPAALSRGLRVHLRASRDQLAGLGAGADRTALIHDIVEQNRLYEIAADRSNAPDLARVLRAFEPVLLELAASDTAPADAEALRAQLAFELNVMLTKLAGQSSDETQTT